MPRLPIAFALLVSACTPVAGVEDLADAPVSCEVDCLVEGTNTVVIDATERDVDVYLPEAPVGAPVVFVWHYLDGSPEEMVQWMGVERLTDGGYIVLAPASRGLPYSEWQIEGDPEANPDVALFDTLLARVDDQFAVDRARVYATGFSAGGLFTTYLTMHRADVLAATAPFSGGTPEWAYASPSTDLPVMVTWGGPTDWYGTFDFAEASQTFADHLADDGHEVVTCEHSSGHWLPAYAQEHVLAFFDDHGGDGEVPWSSAPSRVPDGCSLLSP